MATRIKYSVLDQGDSDIDTYLDDDVLVINQGEDRILCSADNIRDLIRCLQSLEQEIGR